MQVIFGINPLMEALRSEDGRIEKIIVAEGKAGKPVQSILTLAAKSGIPVEFRERNYLDRRAGQKSHQGVVGLLKTYSYVSVDDVIANRHGDFKNDLILILDSITDPQNFGSLLRTAHCCGANGVIIPERRSVSVTPTVMKSSAGAALYIPVAMVGNLAGTVDYLKEKGFWIYGTDVSSGEKITEVDYDGHIVLVMGSEGKGMRPLIRKKCDFLISIPMMGRIGSMNVSVAAGIILYEILRSWRKI